MTKKFIREEWANATKGEIGKLCIGFTYLLVNGQEKDAHVGASDCFLDALQCFEDRISELEASEKNRIQVIKHSLREIRIEDEEHAKWEQEIDEKVHQLQEENKSLREDINYLREKLLDLKPNEIPENKYCDFTTYCEWQNVNLDVSTDPLIINDAYMDYLKHLTDLGCEYESPEVKENFLKAYAIHKSQEYERIKTDLKASMSSDKPKHNFTILYANDEVVLVKLLKKDQPDYHMDIELLDKHHVAKVCDYILKCTVEELHEAVKEFKDEQTSKI